MFSAPKCLVLNRFICYVLGRVRENLVLKFQGVNIGRDVNHDRGRGASSTKDRIRRMNGSS